MPVFATFIVPFDFSEHALAALRFAAGLAKRVNGRLIVVHGLQVPIVSSTGPGYSLRDVIESLRDHLITKIRARLQEEGLVGEIIVRDRAPQLWIDEVARAQPQPVIVLSRHGWSSSEHGLGGVAKRIIQASSVPVWTPQNGMGQIRRVIVALDIDERAKHIAETAAAVAADWNALLTILHVRDPLREVGYLNEVSWPSAGTIYEDAAREAESRLRAIAAELSEPGRNASVHVRAGAIASAVRQEIVQEDAQLLVCGKHTRGRLETLLMGSTTDALLRTVPANVLVVP